MTKSRKCARPRRLKRPSSGGERLEAAWAHLSALQSLDPTPFTADLVEGLPEPVQRYHGYAITSALNCGPWPKSTWSDNSDWAIATDRIVPLVRPRVTVDLVRSAMARSVIEALWTPAALLPRPRAAWEPIDTDRAPALCSGIAAAFGRRAKGLSGNKCTIWGIIIR